MAIRTNGQRSVFNWGGFGLGGDKTLFSIAVTPGELFDRFGGHPKMVSCV